MIFEVTLLYMQKARSITVQTFILKNKQRRQPMNLILFPTIVKREKSLGQDQMRRQIINISQ